MNYLIIGNSGAGKTFLSKIMAAKLKSKVVHLDDLYWEDKFFSKPRKRRIRNKLIEESVKTDPFIIEGVYSFLVCLFIDRINSLIFLDIRYEECSKNLRKRGATISDFWEKRLKNYYFRKGETSREGHLSIFDSFSGQKIRLSSKHQIISYVRSL